MTEQLDDKYNYVSLADSSTYNYASNNLEDWLDNLPIPCVIDEAQRIPALPLAIKKIIDGDSKSRLMFILTGSAAITRNGLDGQDPLTGRALRYQLYPMTQREINRNAQTSVVDLLWDGEPNTSYRSYTERSDLAHRMGLGGFPQNALAMPPLSSEEIRSYIQSDIDDFIGDTILPNERVDRSIASAVLKELLTVPGGILNIKRISDTIKSNNATVERYLSIFTRRFLIIPLPNLRLAPSKQIFTRAKIHPIDTSISAELLKESGTDFEDNPAIFGELFESFVINQIIPEIQWSEHKPDAFFWRDSGRQPKEVDLVLLKDGELIAIEIKSKTKVDRDDFSGIAALEKKDKRFKRGYVIYTGKTIEKFNDHMFAIPISALWDSDGFMQNSATQHDQAISLEQLSGGDLAMTDVNNPKAANIFLSYQHEDNEYLEDGIIKLLKDIQNSYAYLFAEHIELFIDRDNLKWGDSWKEELGSAVSYANIIMPAVTPRYLQSEACRKELLDFYTHAQGDANKKILPLIVQSIDNVRNISDKDPIQEIVNAKQYIEVNNLLHKEGEEKRAGLEELACKLHDVISGMSLETEKSAATREGNVEGYVEELNNKIAEDPALDISVVMSDFTDAFTGLGSVLKNYPAPEKGSISEFSAWSNEVARKVEPYVEKIDRTSDSLTHSWNTLYRFMSGWAQNLDKLPAGAVRNDQIDQLVQIFGQWHASFQVPPDVAILPNILQTIAILYPKLRPLSDTLKKVLDMISNMDALTVSLQQKVGKLPR